MHRTFILKFMLKMAINMKILMVIYLFALCAYNSLQKFQGQSVVELGNKFYKIALVVFTYPNPG